MKRTILFLMVAACGGVQTGGGSGDEHIAGSTGPAMHDPSMNDCTYTLEDSCIDEAALAACQAASAECPGQVNVMESCPLQFGCDGANETTPPDEAPPVPCTDGERRPEDCNTCTCEDGTWACTEISCER
ncbi:MAG: hypothetical protein ACI9KE_005531 [Polyangiales bacterium]|jgi:hypothetical protein